MGCLHPTPYRPPASVKPLEQKKQSSQVLLTELSDLEDVACPGDFREHKVPTLVGRKHGNGRIIQKDKQTRTERENQRAHIHKNIELRRKQEELLRKSIEDHKIQFKLHRDDETTIKHNPDNITTEVARREKVSPISDGKVILAVEETNGPEVATGFRSSRRPDNLVIHDMEDEPEPRPPTYRKADIIPNLSELQTFDKHAKDAPPELTGSVSSLVNYFKMIADNNVQLVRMFYKWIALNISFDVEEYYKEEGERESTEATDVLRRKATTSEGYSNLMAAMCRYVGIPVKVISGLVKGYDYQIGEVINLTESQLRHHWNAVYINGNWFFIDCTWGAGHIDKNHEWHKKYQEFYFIVDPDKMIVDHFPFMDGDLRTSAPWQLLTSPISANSFSQRLKLERAALEWDVKPVTHPQHHTITVRGEVNIELAEVGHRLEDYSIQFKRKDGSRNLDQYFFAYKLNERSLRIRIRPPEEIEYVLNILGRKSIDTSGNAEIMVTYILKCVEVDFPLRKFPYSYKLYGAVPEFDKFGFCSDLTKCVEYTTNTGEMMLPFKSKRSVRCMCKLEHITEKKDLTNYCFVIGKEHGISIKVRLPFQGYYKFTLFGKENKNGNFRPVATFLFDCYEVTHVQTGFPVAFESAMDLKCSLYKPLWKDLPANSQITVILGCPRLQKVTVMFTPLQRDENYIFEGTVTTPPAGQPFIIYGQIEDNSPLLGLYHFTIF